MEGGVMDAATRLARSREIAGNIMQVQQQRARVRAGVTREPIGQSPRYRVIRSHGIRPFVALLTPRCTWREAVELTQRFVRLGDTRLAPAVRASLDSLRSAGRRHLEPVRQVSSWTSSNDGILSSSNVRDRLKFGGLVEFVEATW
ncbi:hypothetical protein CI15_25460 [Paraburkholderia monticola]|uniref:Uncharacterized protein n=1 Tax=Paraburkholderia monticola TaxID=1399968 RepID=A0A149PFR2_9BURK|nr:hypothetical protein CI15_25460 [Paraburkholderia monticola]